MGVAFDRPKTSCYLSAPVKADMSRSVFSCVLLCQCCTRLPTTLHSYFFIIPYSTWKPLDIGHVSLFSRPFIKGAIRDVTFYDVIKPTCVRRSWWMKYDTNHQRPYQIPFRILHLDCAVCNCSRALYHTHSSAHQEMVRANEKERWKGWWRGKMSDPSFYIFSRW